MEHSDFFLGTVDFETYLLIDRLESICSYYLKYGYSDMFCYEKDANLGSIATQLKKLSLFQLILVLIHAEEKLKATVDKVFKTEIQNVIEEINLLIIGLKKHDNVKQLDQAIPLEETDLDKLTLEMLNLSKEKKININEEEAKVISEFLISQTCVNDLEKRLDRENNSSKSISKTNLREKLQLKGIPAVNEKKEKTIYDIMNRMIPTEMKTNSTKNQAELTRRHAYYLEILLTDYETDYIDYLYKLSNLKRKKDPECPSSDVFHKAKDKMVSFYKDNPMLINDNKVENDVIIQELLNQQFVEDTNHFSLLFLTAKILTDFSTKLLSNVNDLNNEDKNRFNNNIFLTIFLKTELRNYNEYTDRMKIRYTKFVHCIDSVVTTRDGIVKNVMKDKDLIGQSVENLLLYLKNNDIELGNSTSGDYSEYFKKVVESFYDVNNPNNPFKK